MSVPRASSCKDTLPLPSSAGRHHCRGTFQTACSFHTGQGIDVGSIDGVDETIDSTTYIAAVLVGGWCPKAETDAES
jgi:hypothetical protein